MKNITIQILPIFISALCPVMLVCPAVLAQVSGTGYYVSAASGNDNYPGTSAQPFQTIQKCADVAKAGDTCNISSGTYREQVTVMNSGTSSAPITFTGMPGQTAIIS